MTDREPNAPSTSVLPSRRVAERVATADPEAVLDQLALLEVSHWEPGDGGQIDTARLGPAAEEFHEAFDLGADDHVAAGDPDGVALAGIQGLLARIETQQAELDRQARRIEAQQETIDTQRADLESLRSTVESVVSDIVALRRSLVDDRQA